MKIHDQEMYVDEEGNPVKEMAVTDSRFDRIAVKRPGSGVILKAKDSDERILEFEAEHTGKLYKGVTLSNNDTIPSRRADVDDDLQDALTAVGFSLISTNLEKDQSLSSPQSSKQGGRMNYNRLFEDAGNVDRELSEHLSREFLPVKMDEDPDEYDFKGELQGKSDYHNPIMRFLDMGGRRVIVDWALQKLYQGDDEWRYKADIARDAETSRQTVSKHMDEIARFGIFETSGDKRTKYRVNRDSAILRSLAMVNQAVMNADWL